MGESSSFDSELRLGQLLIEQGLAKPEHIQESLRAKAEMAAQGVVPLPSLADLLVSRGHLKPDQMEHTLRLAALPAQGDAKLRTISDMTTLPAEAVEAAKDAANIQGRYVKTRKLGAGGMGEVWKAWDTEIRRWVALKFLKSDDAEELARFKREAQTAGKLNHPNIATVYGVGEWGGRPFIAMQFIEGVTLKSFSRRDLRLLATLVRDAALAVYAAHQQGVIHRDLKPENLMVESPAFRVPSKSAHSKRRPDTPPEASDLRIYVLDFGLAKSLDVKGGRSVTGTILGTPSYMSPEQACGDRKLDHHTDIYSLGATLYELTTGHRPFTGAKVFDILKKIVEEEPRRPRQLNEKLDTDLDTIIMKCLQKDPSRRYATAHALADDLTRWLNEEAIQARPASAGYLLRKRIGRNPWAWALAGAAIVALLLVAGVLINSSMKSREADLRARKYEKELADLRAEIAATSDPKRQEELKQRIAALEGKPLPPPEEKPPIEKKPDEPPLVIQPPKTDPNKSKEPDRSAEWQTTLEKVQALCDARKYGEAIDLIANFVPQSGATRQAAENVRAKASADYDDLDMKAQADLKQGKTAAARTAYRLATEWGDPVKDRAQNRLKELTEMERTALLEKLPGLRQEIVALCRDKKYGEAHQRIQDAASKESPPSDDLKLLDGIVTSVRQIFASMAKGADKLKGATIESSLGKGEIVGGTEKQIKLHLIQTGGEITVNYETLPPESIGLLAAAGGASPDSVGLFWLFEGKFDKAGEAWKGSDRRGTLDAFAEQIKSELLEKEARELLAQLDRVEKDKDEKLYQKIVSQKDRLGQTQTWRAASERIEELAGLFSRTTADREIGEFKSKPKPLGSSFEWKYDFAKPDELRDWRLSAESIWPNSERPNPLGHGEHFDKDRKGCYLRNGGMTFIATLEGDSSLVAYVKFVEKGIRWRTELLVGGYLWKIDDGESRFFPPSTDTKEFLNAKNTKIAPDQVYRLELSLKGDALTAKIGDTEVANTRLPEPRRIAAPCVRTAHDCGIIIEHLVLKGTPRAGWSREPGIRTPVAPKSGLQPIRMFDGPAFGRFRKMESGTWNSQDGGWRGTSPNHASGETAELHADGSRNFRLSFYYLFHSGALFSVTVRGGGDGVTQYALPGELPGVWRRVEIVAIESAISCQVGDSIMLLPDKVAEGLGGIGIALKIKAGSVSIKDVELEEIRGVAPEEPWTTIFDGKDLKGFRGSNNAKLVKDVLVLWKGEIETVGSWSRADIKIQFQVESGARIKILFHGEILFSGSVASTGGHSLRIRTEGSTIDALLDGVTVPAAGKFHPGNGPLKFSVMEGTFQLSSLKIKPQK